MTYLQILGPSVTVGILSWMLFQGAVDSFSIRYHHSANTSINPNSCRRTSAIFDNIPINDDEDERPTADTSFPNVISSWKNAPLRPTYGSRSRRQALNILVGGVGSSVVVFGSALTSSNAAVDTDNSIILRLDTPQDKAGLALYDVTIGTPPRTVVAIKRVLSESSNNKLQPGLILKGYPNSLAVLDRIRRGPYPIELEFYNLDSSNGALGDALTAQDALVLAQQQAGDATTSATSKAGSADLEQSTSSNTYVKRVIREAPSNCRIQSRRDDVLEIIYEAHIGSMDGIMYDASSIRGTGRPYQMVLGSGDMIPGVDQGLYNMCPGEIRQLEIPPFLAYGAKGNRLFRIPPNSRLVWEVELVSVNSMRDNDDETGE